MLQSIASNQTRCQNEVARSSEGIDSQVEHSLCATEADDTATVHRTVGGFQQVCSNLGRQFGIRKDTIIKQDQLSKSELQVVLECPELDPRF